jgi:hypothetical protein
MPEHEPGQRVTFSSYEPLPVGQEVPAASLPHSPRSDQARSEPAPAPQPPRPGQGTVYITFGQNGERVACWYDEDRYAESQQSGESALEWARQQPAAEFLILNQGADDYVSWSDR